MMDNCTVFVSSADSYSDLWDIFFDLFQEYWPEYDGEIVLNTQEKDYYHDGLDIKCTKVGKLKGFGATYRAGLDLISTDNIMIFMIDYIFMGKANNEKIVDYYNYFIDKKLDTLSLYKAPFTSYKKTIHDDLLIPLHPYPVSVLFGYQIGFWKKSTLYQMMLPHEDPWMSEWYGSKRAEIMKIREVYLSDNRYCPIKYDVRGCIHRGLWLDNAVDFLNSTYGKKIDFVIRGYYEENPVYNSFSFRIKLKLNMWKTGFKGSYWDLIKRKCLKLRKTTV